MAQQAGEILVKFTTKLKDDLKIDQDEPMVVPSSLARYGLSEIINRMLGFDKPVPFDFLVQDEFLRSDVQSYIEAKGLSSEKVLNLEYVLALSQPEENEVDQVPEWISAVTCLGNLPSPFYAASSFDGTVRFYEAGQQRGSRQLSEKALTAVTSCTPASASLGASLLAAASIDGSVRCCRVKAAAGEDAKLGPVTTLRSTKFRKSMESVALNADGTLVAAGGWDTAVLIWNGGPDAFREGGDAAAGGKRRSPDTVDGAAPKFELEGHSQVVSCLAFPDQARFPYTVLSGSWDSTVRAWDIVAASCVCNWSAARAVESMSMNPDAPQVATSHEDGHVSLWDIRAATPHATVPKAFSLDSSATLALHSAQSPHRRKASQVVWNPLNANLLASVGHDGTLCILDPRSPKMALQRMRLGKQGPEVTKQLCVEWVSKDELVLGDSDGRVVRVSLDPSRAAKAE